MSDKISFFIRRPVTTAMLFLAVVVMGMISLSRLAKELFPSISYPQITILTPYEGAAPEEVESLITQILEESSGAVSGVKHINSISREGLSLVMLKFDWGTKMELAALEVREKIDLVKERLPRDCGEPIVMKYNPFEGPVITLSVTGSESLLDLRETCERKIKDELEKIEGVAAAVITGGLRREILVEVNQPRLRASGLSLLDLGSMIKKSNINYPAGSIKGSFYEHLVRTIGEFQTLKEISDLTVLVDVPETEEEQQKRQMGIKEEVQDKTARLVRISDIAEVKNAAKEQESVSRYNGVENVSISIKRQSGANVIKVCEEVKKAVEAMNKNPSLGVKVEVVYDQSIYIKSSIKGVNDDAVLGGILAFVVLFLFLRSFKFSFIIAVSIPISIVVVFMLMFWQNISLNMISLGGLALGVGMLVDASIVVLDNIFSCQQEREKLNAGGISKEEYQLLVSEASRQMFGAITSTTFTTIVVFLPMMFLEGLSGQLFKQLSFTVTFSLIVSLFVAMTLVPMLCSLGGVKRKQRSREDSSKKPVGLYWRGLSKALDYKVFFILLITGVFIFSLVMLKSIPREFLPRLDQREFTIKLTMEPGTSLKATDSVAKQVENILLKEIPEVQEISVKVGSDEDNPTEKAVKTLASYEAEIMVKLFPKDKDKGGVKRKGGRSTQEVIKDLRTKEKNISGQGVALEYILQESFLKEAFGDKPIQIEIKGENLYTLGEIADKFKKELMDIEGIFSIEDDRVPSSPETKIYILKDQAALYGLSTQDIALTAHTAIKGRVFTEYKEDITEPIDIRVRLRQEDRKDLSRVRSLEVRTSYKEIMVPLYQVARIAKGMGPTEIKRADQRRTITVSANLFGRKVSEVNEELLEVIKKIGVPKEYWAGLSGEAISMYESFRSMRFTFILSILLIYMIMAAQFESLWEPIMIMVTVPFAIIGVVIALKFTGTSMNIIAMLGFIILGGIVVDNGTVLVDTMNYLQRNTKLSLKEVVLTASQMRLRPVLMTSLTTILGLVPLALGMGDGAELRSPMAVTVMGGLISSTFLTLLFIPLLYYSVCHVMEKIRRKSKKD